MERRKTTMRVQRCHVSRGVPAVTVRAAGVFEKSLAARYSPGEQPTHDPRLGLSVQRVGREK